MKKYLYILLLFLGLMSLATSCSTDVAYSRFSPMKSREWHMDSVVCFDYPIVDTTVDYHMVVYVRHTERYPYQNMWLFLGDSVQRDTIEFYLADDRGQWLGDRRNGFIEMPVLYEEHRHFADTGMYRLEIQQGMRDSVLRGITDIGLEIRRNE